MKAQYLKLKYLTKVCKKTNKAINNRALLKYFINMNLK